MKPICIMLVDDNPDDNFFHERVLKHHNPDNLVITKNTGMKALDYLTLKGDGAHEGPYPDLIFLDINMPGMNGWDFLEEYDRLDKELQQRAIIIMLTTSENPDDVARAKGWGVVSDYKSKPLTAEIMDQIIVKYPALGSH